MTESIMKDRKPLIIIAIISMIMTTLLYAGGMFFISGFLPPPSPELSVAKVYSFYQQNHTSIITGLTMAFVGTGFMLPLCIIGCVFMAEVEAKDGFPFFSVMQGLCALATVLFTALPNFMWMTAAFRIDRSPDLIALLHDLGWIMWATPSWGFAFQLICVGVVGLKDKRSEPFIPRWMSYLALWVAVGVAPTPLVPFFTDSGPFAWNGLFTFWVAFFSPILWIAILFVIIAKNIRVNNQHGLARA
ncbi:MAG: hypothetical protein MI867_30190 [Pseudomonadales bacterium]|nr:hypothetical protein [Pseudomonadales bacterium]